MRSHPLRRSVALTASLLVGGIAANQGCGSGNTPSTFNNSTRDTGSGNALDSNTGPNFNQGDGSTTPVGDASVSVNDIVISPASATLDVEVINGVLAASAGAAFSVTIKGFPASATWSIDRGEVGTISSTGLFAPNGKGAGRVSVVASIAGITKTATLDLRLKKSVNGLPDTEPVYSAGAPGGYGGVGGRPLSTTPVPAATVTALQTAVPVAAADLKKIYPYDGTVFPRGLLPPLLQWESAATDLDALSVKITQPSLSFEGVYNFDRTSADPLVTKFAKLQEDVWRELTNANTGADSVSVEVKLHGANGTVYGPLLWTFKIAPGQLKGTVYYASYNSKLTGGATNTELGGVLAIKPRSPNPSLAVPALAQKCHTCHTLSADGSTLFFQMGGTLTGGVGPYEAVPAGGGQDHRDFPWSTKADLRTGALTDFPTPVKGPVDRGTNPATDTADNAHKFTWSAVYPDGSMAFSNNGLTRESRLSPNGSQLFKGDGTNTNVVIPGVHDASMPTFSPDGRSLAFNFFTGAGNGATTAGLGRSLAAADFSCGALPGSVTCGVGATPAFSNVRELYRSAAGYVGWPAFLPDAKSVLFQHTLRTPTACEQGAAAPTTPADTSLNGDTRNAALNCQLSTWYTAESEIWGVGAAGGGAAQAMNALNGYDASGNCTLPASNVAADGYTPSSQCRVNYMPTVNPVPSGGRFWVVFTSRRRYGHVLDVHPFSNAALGQAGFGSTQKKLWVSSIEIKADGSLGASSPAFYLPGQELSAGNARGSWVVDPCKSDGGSCESGDECCGGFCRAGAGGALTCQAPPANTCALEFESCKTAADCCDTTQACVAGRCAVNSQVN